MNKNILFEDSAVKEVLSVLKLKYHYGWHSYRLVNKSRYAIICGFGSPNIAILLKTEPFMTFGKQKFKKEDGSYETGVGDSINTEYLKLFVKEKVETIYTLFRDGKLYKISLLDFLSNSHSWVQKEGTKVRSISIHLYERVNRESEER